MIIIGHPWIESPSFAKVFSIEDIQKSNPQDIVLLEPLVDSHTYAQHCKKNNIPFAIVITGLNNAIFANALGAKYIICEEDTALIIQPIAQEYLFDTRILVLIHSEKEISKVAREHIDGVIFPEAIY
jgi:hypothetical protein